MKRIDDNNLLYIVMYHYTRDLKRSRYSKIKGLDLGLFRKQLDYFGKNFNIIRMETLLECLEGRKLEKNSMLLTFDDGYMDNFTVAFPELMKRGMTAAFFPVAKTLEEEVILDTNKIHLILATAREKDILDAILSYIDNLSQKDRIRLTNSAEIQTAAQIYKKYAKSNGRDTIETSFIKLSLQTLLAEENRYELIEYLFKKYVGLDERILSKEFYIDKPKLRHMKEFGMYVGVHGYDHLHLGELEETKMRADIDKALYVMEEFTGRNFVMNYPYGSYNDGVISYIREKGSILGLTTKEGRADLVNESLFELRRFDCNYFYPVGQD